MRKTVPADLLNTLGRVGLSVNESRVYLLLLEKGDLPASQLAKLAKLSRPNCYNILATLEEKQLCTVRSESKKTVFRPNSPDSLRDHLQLKQRNLKDSFGLLENNIDLLFKYYSHSQGAQGSYQFDGVEGLRPVYEGLLKDRLTVYSIQDRFRLRSSLAEFNSEWLKGRRKYRMWNHIISPVGDDASIRSDERDDKLNYRKIKYIPRAKFPFEIDLKSNGKKVVITSFADEATKGIVITDPIIAANFQVIFNLIWNLV